MLHRQSYEAHSKQRLWEGDVLKEFTQTAFTCSKLTIETLEQCVKYVQS